MTKAEPIDTKFIPEHEAAEYLHMDHSALKIMRQKKTGPAFAKVGRRHLYFKADLDNWVIHRRQSSLLEPVELGLK